MSFVECIGRKVHHLIKDMAGYRFRHSPFYGPLYPVCTMNKVFPLPGHNIMFLFAHGTAYEISASHGIACQRTNDFLYLFLIDHTAICVGKDRFQSRIFIMDGSGVMLSLHISWDALHGAGTIQCNTCNDIFEAVRFELHKELPHPRRFQLEHSVRIST